MAKRRRRRKKKSMLQYIRLPRLDLDPETKKGIWIVFVVLIAFIFLLGLFQKAGIMGEYTTDWLSTAFGWGRWIIPFFLLFWSYALFDDERFELSFSNYLGFLLFFISIHTLEKQKDDSLLLGLKRYSFKDVFILLSQAGFKDVDSIYVNDRKRNLDEVCIFGQKT